MNSEKPATTNSVPQTETQPLHPKGIREHTDGREFRPYGLLGVTIAIAAVLAVICYGIQLYFIGPG